MKIGIVGTGLIVKEFLPIMVTLQGVECKAICGTPNSKEEVDALCDQYQIAYGFTDFSKMLEADIDTVYVAIPNFLHYQFCVEALKANKNVIVEKPMTSNYAEASTLATLAKDKQLFFFEAITTQYLANYKKIQELLPQIGDIKFVQCNYSQYSRRYDAFKEGNILPAFDPAKSGGALMDLNLYNLHYVMGLFGVPEKVEYHANMERGIDTNGAVILKYNKFHAICIAAKDCGAPARSVIQGTKGYLLQDSSANVCGEVTLHLNDGTEQTFDLNENLHRMATEFISFAQQIASGEKTSCYQMLEHSLAVSKVMFEARLFAGIRFAADEIE